MFYGECAFLHGARSTSMPGEEYNLEGGLFVFSRTRIALDSDWILIDYIVTIVATLTQHLS